MLRVAVDANALAWGWSGIPRYVDAIVRELAARDDTEVTLLANASAPFTEISGVRQAYGRRKGGTVWRHTFVVPWLARRRPDVYWAPETLAPLWTPVPTVVTVHDLATALMPATKPLRLRLGYRLSAPRTTRSAARVIAVSNATARDVQRLWRVPASSIRVVAEGVDGRFSPGDRGEAARTVRDRFGVDQPFVLYVGALEPRKGVDLLAETAALARSEARPYRFVLAGAPGFEGEELAAAARNAGAAILGPVADDDLVQLYRAAEALAVPSRYEGFGLTPLEAMASGTPAVIAAGAGALEEVSGPAAVVVRERTARAWVAGLDEAIERRDELAARGLEHVRQFRWPEVAAEIRQVLKEAARS